MLQLIFGRANSGKSNEIYRRVCAAVEAGEQAVLLVPEQSSFESERGLLHAMGGVYTDRVEVLSFTRLASILNRETCGPVGITLDECGRFLLMGQVLARVAKKLQVYHRGNTAEFIHTILQTMNELQQAAVTPEWLLTIAGSLDKHPLLKGKLQDLALIQGEYDALLQARNLSLSDDLTKLYDQLGEKDWFQGKTVFFDEFDGFTGQQMQIMHRIFEQAKNITFALPADGLDGRMGDRSPFVNVRKTAQKLVRMAGDYYVSVATPLILSTSYFASPALTAAELCFSGLSEEVFEEATEDITLVSTASVFDEVEYTAAAIHRKVREEGGRYGDFVVIARDMNVYAGPLQILFRRYKIPLFLDLRRPASSLPLYVLVQSAVTAALKFSTEAILRLLKSGLAGLCIEEISKLENYTYVWNITGSGWLQPWEKRPDGFQNDLSQEVCKERLEQLNTLREQVVKPLFALQEALQSGNAKRMAGGIYQYLQQIHADENLKKSADAFELQGEAETANLQRQSYDSLINLLDQMAVSFPEEHVSATQFRKMLESVIGCVSLGSIPQKLDSVVAGAAGRIRPGRPSHTFLLGFQQGAFPQAPNAGLLNPSERRLLEEAGVEIRDCRLESALEESFLLYRTLFSCFRTLTITYPREDLNGNPIAPSVYLNRILEYVPHLKKRNLSVDNATGCTLPETQDSGISMLARNWHAQTPEIELLRQYYCAEAPARYFRLARLAEPGGHALSAETARRLFGTNIVMSASQLDTFYRCRFSYFCHYGMRLRSIRPAVLDQLQRGTAAHYVLEGMIRRHHKKIAELSEEQRNAEVSQLLRDYAVTLAGDLADSDLQFRYLLASMEAMLQEVLGRIADEFRISAFAPAYCELKIGFDQDCSVKALRVSLQDGSVSIIGLVDRVDTMEFQNQLVFRVVDYKTGTREFALSDVFYGLNMQMLIYLLALRKNGIDGVDKPLIEGGVVYQPVKRVELRPGENCSLATSSRVRLNGLLNNSREILEGMNPSLSSGIMKTPVDKDNNPTEYQSPFALLGTEDFSLLEAHISHLIAEAGNQLHQGNISISPRDGLDSDACHYCEFSSVCNREPGASNETVTKRKTPEILELWREAYQHGN